MTGFTSREHAERTAAHLLANAIRGEYRAVTELYELLVAAGRHETITPPTTTPREP